MAELKISHARCLIIPDTACIDSHFRRVLAAVFRQSKAMPLRPLKHLREKTAPQTNMSYPLGGREFCSSLTG
jgi:hypothetical protein